MYIHVLISCFYLLVKNPRLTESLQLGMNCGVRIRSIIPGDAKKVRHFQIAVTGKDFDF